jgi:hypothetical protein
MLRACLTAPGAGVHLPAMERLRRHIFLALCAITTALFTWLLAQGYHAFTSPAAIPVLACLAACTLALCWRFPVPVSRDAIAAPRARRFRFALAAVAAIMLLFAGKAAIGPWMLFLWPGTAIAVLLIVKARPGRREWAYAAVLSVAAGLAATGAEWVKFNPALWVLLQIAIVLAGLPASWELLRVSGLREQGVGRSVVLEEGVRPATGSLLAGAALALPWALGMVLIGGADAQTWVRHWWQPFAAVSPAIGEEVWGRLLPVPLMFLLLRKSLRPRSAYFASMLVMNYWFAYLHTSGGAAGIVPAALTGTLFILPISFLCLHRDMETAFGFHFAIDFVKFVAALLINTRLFPG